jgi:MFS family permease
VPGRVEASPRWTSSLRSLPRPVRRLLLIDLVSNVGSGLVLPFLAIYVVRVRGHEVIFGGAVVAVLAVGSLISNAVAGHLADRFSAGAVLRVGWLIAAAGDVVLLTTSRVLILGAAALIIGAGVGAALPALRALMGEFTIDGARRLTFALQHGLTNIGFSVGALLAAVVVSGMQVSRFQILYALDAASFVVAAALLSRIRPAAPRTSARPAAEALPAGGYRQVFDDRRFRRYALISGLLVVCGYVQFHAALPIFLSRPGGLPPASVALVFAANSITVAVAALPVALAVRRLSYTTLLVAGATAFAASWVLLAESARWGTLSACAAAAVMGLAETLLSPALGPLLNDLAPSHLRGRYNGADALIFSTGSIVGPPLAAALYYGGSSQGLFGFLVGGCTCAALVTVSSRKALAARPACGGTS